MSQGIGACCHNLSAIHKVGTVNIHPLLVSSQKKALYLFKVPSHQQPRTTHLRPEVKIGIFLRVPLYLQTSKLQQTDFSV